MAKYYVPFTYEKGGKIEVEAASPKEAVKAAEKSSMKCRGRTAVHLQSASTILQ